MKLESGQPSAEMPPLALAGSGLLLPRLSAAR